MSFGKRSRVERQAVPVPRGDVEVIDLDEVDDEEGVPKWKLMLLAGVGSIAAVFCLAIFVLPKLMQAGNAGYSAPLAEVPKDPSQLVFALPVRDIADAKIKSNEALRKSCFSHEYDVRKVPDPVPGQDRQWQIADPATGQIYHSFFGGSGVLSCMLTQELPRLCDADERKQMASALSAFSSVQKKLASNGLDANGLPVSADANGDATVFDDGPSSVSATLVNALNLVSKLGYLSSDDFSEDVPDEFAPFITAAKASPCD